MTYRHIYTDDPNPCPVCDGCDTEPTDDGTGRECACCGTARPDAFDPDRDPFNPEREGWRGWWRNGPYIWQTYRPDGESGWCVIHGNPASTTYIRDPYRVVLYRHATIPHATVVSILVSCGYVPEVGV